MHHFWLRQCSKEAEKINRFLEPVWAKKLFDRIRSVCYGTKFFYDLFWIVVGKEPKLKQIVNNYRRHQFAKRLFRKF